MKGSAAILLMVCGLAKAASFSNKITGGQEATPHSFPHQAALYIEFPNGNAFCGGSIISEKVILTAAHCVEKAIRVKVIVGAHNINITESTTQTYDATEFIVHEKWSLFTKMNDIALIILKEKIVFNAQVKKIQLPRANEVIAVGQKVTVSGWGFISDQSKDLSSQLYYVTSTILSLKVCNTFYNGTIGKTQICMKGSNGLSACHGDSGGALVVKSRDRAVQYGIVSFSSELGCEIGYPSIYTNVPSFIRWIHEKMSATRKRF